MSTLHQVDDPSLPHVKQSPTKVLKQRIYYLYNTPKCNGTLKSNGYAKVRWYAPNPNGLTFQSNIVQVQSPKFDGEEHQSLMVHTNLPNCDGFPHQSSIKIHKSFFIICSEGCTPIKLYTGKCKIHKNMNPILQNKNFIFDC